MALLSTKELRLIHALLVLAHELKENDITLDVIGKDFDRIVNGCYDEVNIIELIDKITE